MKNAIQLQLSIIIKSRAEQIICSELCIQLVKSQIFKVTYGNQMPTRWMIHINLGAMFLQMALHLPTETFHHIKMQTLMHTYIYVCVYVCMCMYTFRHQHTSTQDRKLRNIVKVCMLLRDGSWYNKLRMFVSATSLHGRSHFLSVVESFQLFMRYLEELRVTKIYPWVILFKNS